MSCRQSPVNQSHSLLRRLWIAFLCLLIGIGCFFYYRQLALGLQVTGLSRDVSWGFYIAQSTYQVGVAASAVVPVLPTYFHRRVEYASVLLLGEFLAAAAVVMGLLFIIVDLGQPQRIFAVLLHPSPSSPIFWDMVALSGYLLLCLIVAKGALTSERYSIAPPKRFKYLVYAAVFWAFSIHTVTAFLYAGLPDRPLWFTGLLAARFLASAFCSGPAILLLLCFGLQRLRVFTPEKNAVRSLSLIIAYAMGVNIFFFLLELFTALYSGIPAYSRAFALLFGTFPADVAVQTFWLPWWMRVGAGMSLLAFALLAFPKTRDNARLLPVALALVVASTWVEKGLVFIAGGLMLNPFGRITAYRPSVNELAVSLGIYALGALLVTLLWRLALRRRREASGR